jgi:Protein of unknown function (DUF3489)
MTLTGTQLVLLTSASQREDHLVTLPPNLKGGAAKKVVGKLLDLGLVKEIPVTRDQPAWRTDNKEGFIGLKLTGAGLKALGIEPGTVDEPDAPEALPKKRSRKAAGKRAHRAGPDQAPRAGSKQALVISLLSRAKGATLDHLVNATGWLPHTTRAALTGMRRRGHELAKTKNAVGQTVYRIEQEGSGRPAKDGA